MNKKPTKFRETRGNRHPSQNDLPPIDKFHPDYWYYREEMDEPDDIDINYENESKNMNKKVIRLTESDLHRIVKESVKKILNEIGDTGEGQRSLGALQARKVINADGDSVDDLFKNQEKEGGAIYGYAKRQRSKTGEDSDMYGNTINPLYKDYCKGYHEYINSHPEEFVKRNERLRKLGY